MIPEGDPNKKCGSCKYFDLNHTNGEPIGTKPTRDNNYVLGGVCRNSKAGALTLGVLTRETLCKRPEFFCSRQDLDQL